MNNEQRKILNYCQNYFLENGFYKTTMDEIAAELRMSKKTIYKYYSTKEGLVRESIQMFLEQHKNNISEIVSSDLKAVTKLHRIFNYLSEIIFKINEKFIKDIQAHMPDLWQDIDKFRTKLMTINIGSVIEQGKNEGVFVDRSSAIITSVFISAVRGVINPEFIMSNKFSIKMALDETIEIIINGITTQKGKIEFQLLRSEKSNENN